MFRGAFMIDWRSTFHCNITLGMCVTVVELYIVFTVVKVCNNEKCV